jgi:ATP-independent RNA helicase DbpA
VDRKIAHDVVARLNSGKIKGRTVKARLLKD